MKKLLIILVIVMMCVMFTGCGKVGTPDTSFAILDEENGIVYDKRTDICYYRICAYASYTYFPFYNEDKEMVTRKEYIEEYGNMQIQ